MIKSKSEKVTIVNTTTIEYTSNVETPKNENTKLKNILKGFFAILLYFLVSLFKEVPLLLVGIHYNSLSVLGKEFYSLSIEVLLIVAIILIFKEQFKNAFDDLKKNHLKYFTGNFKYYILGVIIMMLSNAIILSLGGNSSDNETAIRSQFASYPIFTFISAVFLAPILEESVFRLSFRNIFKNNILFILASGFVFGGLHLTGMLDSNLFFLYLVSYSSMGVVFAYMLTKTNNIFVTMGFHFMHNGILMSLQTCLLLFG